MDNLGPRIAGLRKSKGLTLQDVASAASLSKSFISQVESGVSVPSIASLKKIVAALDVQLGDLFDEGHDHDPGDGGPDDAASPAGQKSDVQIVRHDKRKRISWPDRTSDAALLTPSLQRKLEVLLTTEEPGEAGHASDPYHHEGEEFGLVLEGSFEVTVAGETFVLEKGDSIYFSSHHPHSTRAVGKKPATTLWVITPPTF